MEEGLKRLMDDKTVLYTSSHQFTHISNKNYNQIQFPISKFGRESSIFYSLLLPKNSPLTEIFKRYALHSIQSGLRDAIWREWIGPKLTNHNQGGKAQRHNISIWETMIFFMVLFVFLGLSLVTMFFEILFKKFWNKDKK